MITGRWGKPSEVLLDIVAEPDGVVRGVANPGRQNAPIRRGHFDSATRKVHLEGEYADSDGAMIPFSIDGHLEGRTLILGYVFGEMSGTIELVRVEEYTPPRLTIVDRLMTIVVPFKRGINAAARPSGAE